MQIGRLERIEHKLLLASARSIEQIKDWSPSDYSVQAVDWQYVFDLAKRHKTVPLLHLFLNEHPALNVPEKISLAIEQFVHRQALTNIFQTNELLRVISCLEEEGIESIPFKGPALGMYLYNQISYRPFGDLDLLIHREDFQQTKILLKQLGYEPFRDFNTQKEKAFLSTQMGYEFVRQDDRCVIEIHWSLLNKIHAFTLEEETLWKYKKTMPLQDKHVYRFSDEHLFVYLCAHGSKSFWARLRWVTDIAELISRFSRDEQVDLKWKGILKTARNTNSIRMVHLGIFLAHHLLKAEIPPSVGEDIEADPGVTELAERVTQGLFVQESHIKSVFKPVSFHLLMQKSMIHRLPYIWHIARLWIMPTDKDRKFVKLPPTLDFLYYFIKPFRILVDLFSGSKA